MGSLFSRISRDVQFLSTLLPVLSGVKKIGKNCGPGKWTISDFWDKVVKQHDSKIALQFEDQQFTYKEMDLISNKLANWFLENGFQQGETVGISITNSPEFLFLLLGLWKIGIRTALCNTNIQGDSLKHCLDVCNIQKIIFHQETSHIFRSFHASYESQYQYYIIPSKQQDTQLEKDIGILIDYFKHSDKNISNSNRNQVSAHSPLMHVFTSGTTGLPKAAKVSHLRFYGGSILFSRFGKYQETDRLYCTLPMYHSSGLIIGWGGILHVGGQYIIRRKFSVQNFWKDCQEYKITIIQYIGEICRFLCSNQSQTINDRTHEIRLAIGNGLRPEIWKIFQERFHIPHIVEFYASTEGNIGFINAEQKIGAVGFLSPLLKAIHPGCIVRFNYETNEIERNEQGYCIECDINEPGELIGLIDDHDPTRRFDGYTNQEETNRKIIHNAFKQGDKYFRSGDLLSMDKEGFIYFIDRIGDTFRWKGENVSTTEVSSILAKLSLEQVIENVVYGVQIDHNEGRGGMALLRLPLTIAYDIFDFAKVYEILQELPKYSQPIFIRLTHNDIISTATFKYKKNILIKEGFTPENNHQDPIYYRDDNAKTYVPLSMEIYKDITEGKRTF